MQIDRMDLFPVPVLGAEFNNGEELRKTLVPIIHDIEKADIMEKETYVDDILDSKELEELIDKLSNKRTIH